MLFLDLEAYVPVADRRATLSSLIVNPANPSHIILGGCFFSKKLLAQVPENLDIEHLWLWNFPSECALISAIKAKFEAEWRNERRENENIKILGKPVTDLVVCGAGIAKFDLSALFCRGQVHQLAPSSELYEVFLKPRPIDLANEASFLFPEEGTLYPKTTKEIGGRLKVPERKGSSKSVWDLYEAKDYRSIEERTEAELRTVVELYRRLQRQVTKRPGSR